MNKTDYAQQLFEKCGFVIGTQIEIVEITLAGVLMCKPLNVDYKDKLFPFSPDEILITNLN